MSRLQQNPAPSSLEAMGADALLSMAASYSHTQFQPTQHRPRLVMRNLPIPELENRNLGLRRVAPIPTRPWEHQQQMQQLHQLRPAPPTPHASSFPPRGSSMTRPMMSMSVVKPSHNNSSSRNASPTGKRRIAPLIGPVPAGRKLRPRLRVNTALAAQISHTPVLNQS